MFEDNLSKKVKELGLKCGDGILVVLKSGDVYPVKFVSLGSSQKREGSDTKLNWVFYGAGLGEIRDTDCPNYPESGIVAILPIRNGEEMARLLAAMLNFLTQNRIGTDIFLRKIFGNTDFKHLQSVPQKP